MNSEAPVAESVPLFASIADEVIADFAEALRSGTIEMPKLDARVPATKRISFSTGCGFLGPLEFGCEAQKWRISVPYRGFRRPDVKR
jgi:hypothetical protein